MKHSTIKKRIISISGILMLIVIWKTVSILAGSEQVVPSPEKTLISITQIFIQPEFWPSLGITILRGLAGFAISVFFALLIGIPAGMRHSFFVFINPLLVTIRSTPVISLILLAIIWLGNEQVPVFIALLTMFPVMCTNIIEGIRNVDEELVEMGKVYRIPSLRIILEIYFPSIAPFLIGGISNALGFGWRAIIIGEVLSQPENGIGTQMQKAQTFLQVSELIAWTLIAILISYLFEHGVRIAEKKFIRWK